MKHLSSAQRRWGGERTVQLPQHQLKVLIVQKMYTYNYITLHYITLH